jgi:hypothetical protein
MFELPASYGFFLHIYSMTQQVNISSIGSTTTINEALPQRLLQIQGPALGKRPSLRGGLNPQAPAPPTGRHKARGASAAALEKTVERAFENLRFDEEYQKEFENLGKFLKNIL